MFKSLVVPLDGSPFAERALDRAISLARSSRAKLHLVRVHSAYPVPYTYDAGVFVAATDPAWDAKIRRGERTYLAAAARRASAAVGGAVVTRLLDGPAASAIAAYAEAGRGANSPLIVMSTHGVSGASRLWLGSTADAVVRNAVVPVLLVRPGRTAKVRDPAREYRRVLVPLDGSSHAERVLQPVLDLAPGSMTEVLLLSVVVRGPRSPLYWLAAATGGTNALGEVVAEERRGARRYLSRVAAKLRTASPQALVNASVVTGRHAAAKITAAAALHRPDLIAMTSHGRGASRLVLGSVIDKVMRATTADLLVVRARASHRSRT